MPTTHITERFTQLRGLRGASGILCSSWKLFPQKEDERHGRRWGARAEAATGRRAVRPARRARAWALSASWDWASGFYVARV